RPPTSPLFPYTTLFRSDSPSRSSRPSIRASFASSTSASAISTSHSGGSFSADTTRSTSPRSATSSARRGFRRRDARGEAVKVILRNPRREVEVPGERRVKDVLRELDILPETVLVIRGDDLVTADQMLRDDDVIELRPVMSGGAR